MTQTLSMDSQFYISLFTILNHIIKQKNQRFLTVCSPTVSFNHKRRNSLYSPYHHLLDFIPHCFYSVGGPSDIVGLYDLSLDEVPLDDGTKLPTANRHRSTIETGREWSRVDC